MKNYKIGIKGYKYASETCLITLYIKGIAIPMKNICSYEDYSDLTMYAYKNKEECLNKAVKLWRKYLKDLNRHYYVYAFMFEDSKTEYVYINHICNAFRSNDSINSRIKCFFDLKNLLLKQNWVHAEMTTVELDGKGEIIKTTPNYRKIDKNRVKIIKIT